MIVLYVVLCFSIRAYRATPLYLEIHHRDPLTGDILSTTEMEIENDINHDEKDIQPQIHSSSEEEINPVALEYYYGCSMPLPPPIERSNFDKEVESIPISSAVIENSNTSYNVREPNSATDSVVDTTIGGVNGLVLQLMSLGFRAFNRFV
ncbi:uncharacterized protein LOC135847347 [Planococcus citri]|uniref:uncharacterized protein LOC135847347 n=1 Tax=Planococcus citri TaxID=170843 RepID=UPI0031F8470C